MRIPLASLARLALLGAMLAASHAWAGPDDALPRRPVAVVADLIAQAEPGDEIRLPPGIYEGNLVVLKSVALEGGGRAVFDGLGKGTVVEVHAEKVSLRGCVIRGSGRDVAAETAGLRVLAASATIESNVVEDSYFGIDLREAPDSRVRDNVVVGKALEPERRGDGIRLWWCPRSLVEGNSVRQSRDMVFWYSEDLRIVRNVVTGSRYGLHFMYSDETVLEENDLRDNSVGVYLMYSDRITLRGNRMRNNRGASGYGLGLKDCDDIVVVGNALLANRVGVYVDNSPSSIGSTGVFEGNLFAFNEIGVLATPNTHDNVFVGNGFVENEEPATTHGRGRLASNAFSRDGVGNYWSDYAGFDLDSDGIGDVSFEPRSLFGAMLAHEPNLRLLVHGPAQQAIEFTSRALPELRPESMLVDPFPLASPPRIALSMPDDDAGGLRMWILAIGLFGTGSAAIVALGLDRGIRRTAAGGTS